MKENMEATRVRSSSESENNELLQNGEPDFRGTKHIEEISKTMLDVKHSLSAAYLEAGMTLKNTLELFQLNVPQLKDLSNTVIRKEPSPQSSLQENSSRSTKPFSENLKSQPAPSLSRSTNSSKSKWTLKHQGPGLGLIELMPKTRIYVSETELKRCKFLYTDMRKFGRLLLPLVFSKEALLKCSFSGLSRQPLPGLDKYARKVLLDYVTKHAEQSGWDVVDRGDLIASLNSRMKYLQKRKYKCSLGHIDIETCE